MVLPRYPDAVISESLPSVVFREGLSQGVPAHVVIAECSTYDHVIVICKLHDDEGLHAPVPQIVYSLTINDELLFEFKETDHTVEIHIGRKVENPIYLHFIEKASFWRFAAAARHAKMLRLDQQDQLKALHEQVVNNLTAVHAGFAAGDLSALEANVSTA